jgi:hypothetical protein
MSRLSAKEAVNKKKPVEGLRHSHDASTGHLLQKSLDNPNLILDLHGIMAR